MAGNVSSVLVAVNGGSIKPTALKQPEEPEKEGAIGRVRLVQGVKIYRNTEFFCPPQAWVLPRTYPL